jgi:TIR domain
MNQVFNPPPNWPKPPTGWSPSAEWRPDPAWGPPPSGWSFWVEEGEDADASDPGADGKQHIFISYRRSDSQAQANGLYDGLLHRLSNASLFMDIDSIPPGVDFEEHIRQEIKRSDVVLVMIGDNWLDSRPGSNRRRVDEDDDFVRLEIENALATPSVRIIPILVEGAQMPPSVELPESIHQLTRLQAFELSDHRWTSDVERLARTIERPGLDVVPDESAGDAGPDQRRRRRASTAVGWLIAAVPLLTFGIASFAPALWARSQRPEDAQYRRQMLIFAIIVGIVSIGSFVLVGVSEAESIGNAAVGILFGTVAVATVVAILNRKPALQSLGSSEEHQRQQRRAEYRRLINTDINLARSMSVGRPDLQRNYDDGGLLDLNSLPVEALVSFGVPVDEAARIVNARQAGTFSTLNEVAMRCNLTRNTVARLRETAVFL